MYSSLANYLPEHWMLWLIGATLALLLFSPVRAALAALISTFLTPGLLVVMTTCFLWVWWIIKRVVHSHRIVLSNLVRPHSVIFPTLARPPERKRP